jgi:hypothetical protein
MKEGGSSPDSRIAWMYRLVCDRQPGGREIGILKQLFREQRELFMADSESAKKLLAVGETSADPTLDPVDLAAGTVLAEALLNSDDAIMRR